MARSMIGGGTDYSHQNLDDIIEDLENEARNTKHFLNELNELKSDLVRVKYWPRKVEGNFLMEISYAMKFYQSAILEMNSISSGLKIEVLDNHYLRLKKVASVADDINRTIGKTWKSDYNKFEYDDDDWRKLERMYHVGRDMAVNLLDLYNMASRLKDYVGMKQQVENKTEEKNMNILFMSASPNDQNYLRVDEELREVKKQIDASQYRDKINLVSIHAAQLQTITQEITKINPDIIHFSGHSDKDGINIEDAVGDTFVLPVTGMVRLLSLFKDNLKCVVFNSCHSADQAQKVSKLGVPVIGMNDEIDDDVAIQFSVGFYQAIGNGKDVNFAYQMGMVLVSPSIDNSATPELWINGEK